MAGISETKDVLRLITTLGVLIGAEASGDGLEITDVLKLFNDDDFREKLILAFDRITLVPGELSDLSIDEGFDLSILALETVREILSSFSSKAA